MIYMELKSWKNIFLLFKILDKKYNGFSERVSIEMNDFYLS